MDWLDIETVEATIGIPVEDWVGSCHGISNKLLEHNIVKGKLRYGHWKGPVSPYSIFATRPVGLIRHGWVELPDERIVDPTRFGFENAHPYIYVGENDYYDAGGNIYRKQTMRPAPEYDRSKMQIILVPKALAEQFIAESLKRFTSDGAVSITINQAFWLANLPLDVLGVAAREVYQALMLADHGGLIPYDNKHLVFEEEKMG